jgi:hypothetical protein
LSLLPFLPAPLPSFPSLLLSFFFFLLFFPSLHTNITMPNL